MRHDITDWQDIQSSMKGITTFGVGGFVDWKYNRRLRRGSEGGPWEETTEHDWLILFVIRIRGVVANCIWRRVNQT